jgi:hypothetical protein
MCSSLADSRLSSELVFWFSASQLPFGLTSVVSCL